MWDHLGQRPFQLGRLGRRPLRQRELNDPAAVANLVGRYDPSKSIRDLLTQTGQVAYARPEPLYDTSYETRLRVAKELIPESIALTVTVLTKGANSFDAQTAL